jgi:twitching motility protein PilT
MARIDSFLRLVVEQRASDLHLPTGSPPIIRHNGDLVPLPFRVLSSWEAERLIGELLTDKQKQTLAQERDLDFVYEIPDVGRFRGSVFVQSHGLAAVFRVIPRRIPSMDELLLPPVVKRLTRLGNGLVLVTGPTGSGKTTTLAAMITEINRSMRRHVITIEDPIEFLHEPASSVITQREVGAHAESFSGALRSALRESPDVVMVGEMRDLETVTLALSAAETGVLVLGTLHTNSASKSIDRIIDIVPEEGQDQIRATLSVILRGVVAQQLVKRRGGEGRLAVLEILLQDIGISHMIRENKLHLVDAHLKSANPEQSGMQSNDHHLFELVRDGLVDPDEGLRTCTDPDLFRSRLEGLPQEVEE